MVAAIVHAIRTGRGILLFGLTVLSVFWCLGCAPAVYQTSAEVYTSTDDYEYLSYYGQWVEVPPYGMVWRPGVVSDWAPFYNGHWVWSNYGWTWVSYEPYGWLVYHYGNWDYQPTLGWFWCPGRRWSPARVQWMTFGDYTAWAPLPPPNAYWPDPWEPYPVNVWVVVNINDFTREDIGRHRMLRPVPRESIPPRGIHKRAPDVQRLEVMTRQTVPQVKIQKQDIDVRRQVTGPVREFDHSPKTTLERMVLPPAEKTRMEEHMPKVEREVITPRKGTPPSTPQPVEKKKKSDTGQRKKGG